MSSGLRNLKLTDRSYRKRHARRRRRLLVESLESRRVLAQVSLTAVADGEIADQDLDGTFETFDTTGTTISNRWFNIAGIGQERGAFEFDLSGIAGSTITSAKIGLDVAVYNSPIDAVLEFHSYAGDGAITLADGDVAAAAAGSGTVTGLGYLEFPLNAAALDAHVGGYLGLRMQNTALDDEWTSVRSLEGSGTSPTLILEYDPAPTTAGVTVSPTSGLVTSESGGTADFTVVLDSQPTADVSIDFASSDLSEGTASPSTVTFTSSNWNVAQTVTVTGTDDVVADGDQAYTIVTGPVSSNDINYGSPTEPIALDNVEQGEFTPDGSNINGTDFMVIGEHTTYGEYRSFLTFDLSGVTVPATDASLSLQVDYYNATSSLDFSVYDYVLGNDAALGGSMTSVAAFNDLGSGQVYGSASINSSDNPVGSTFTIDLNAAALADINDAGGLFTFGFADDLITGGNNANIRLDRSPSIRVNQLLLWVDRPGIDPDDVSVTNQDNETPTLSVSVLDDELPETAGIEATAVTIARNTDTASELVVELSSDKPDQATVPVTATIPAGHHQVTVFLDVIDDAIVDGPQTVTITASATGFTAGDDSLIVTDVESDSLGDRVWHDSNGNGMQDAGEPGIAGAVVELFQTSDTVIGNADDVSRGIDVTDSQGNYQLAGLVDSGRYYLQFRTPSGYTFTTQDVGGDDGVDSDADNAGFTATFVHSAGPSPQGWDAGLVDGPPDFGFAGRAGGPLDDNASAVDTDAAGNVYVTGVYREEVDFDFGPGHYGLHACTTDDVFVAKYTPAGALIWARGVAGSGTDESHSLDVSESAKWW